MLEDLSLPYVQRGLGAVLVLAFAAGLLGTWIVLRGLAFFSHAVGTAAFPGLVLADGLGFAAALGALGSALVVAALVALLTRRRAGDRDAATALVLAGALAAGVLLASDVFGTQAGVETLLFGSLLAVGGGDLALAAGAAAAVAAAGAVLGSRWLATGFDPETARASGLRSPVPDAALLALVALVAVAALSLVGALLATALLVVPAATTRLLCDRMRAWQIATALLAAAEGALGLWLALRTNAPPGATIAVVAGAGFVLAAALRALRGRPRRALATAAAALAALASGCGAGAAGGGSDDDRLRVVASTPQVADIARQVAGDRAEVTTLLRPGTDPHDYEPRPADVRAVAGADVVLASGLGLDPWVAEVARSAGGGARVLQVGDEVPLTLGGAGVGRPHEGDPGHEEGAASGEADPHWWHEPRNVVAAARAIGRALGTDPGRYVAEVERVTAAIADCLGALPAPRRRLVTDHDAFAYFAAAYGLALVGAVIPSTSSQAQASAGDLARLARAVERNDVPAVFPERGLSPDLARTLAERTGARVGEALYADALGRPGTREATLLGAEQANADAIVRGLLGRDEGCPRPGR